MDFVDLPFVRQNLDDDVLPFVLQNLKTHNVLMTLDGVVKLNPFGPVMAGEPSDDSANLCLQARAPKEGAETVLSNSHSWAAIVLEMFLGRRPWKSEITLRKNIDQFLALESRVEIPKDAIELLRLCIKDPSDFLFASIDETLASIYGFTIGRDYPRPIPPEVPELNDKPEGLNNKALSLLSMGDGAGASNLWKSALRLNPNHPESQYNFALYLWRQGIIDDLEALERVSEISESLHYIASLHLERGDRLKARAYLDQAQDVYGKSYPLEGILSRIEAQDSGTIEFKLKNKNDRILAISPGLTKGLILTTQPNESFTDFVPVLEVFDLASNQTLSRHPRTSLHKSVDRAAFVDEASFIVTWCHGEEKSVVTTLDITFEYFL
ncbi:MAG: hypothetical protein LBJ61_02695, partial [Deltaproteobacteria bacterium]|nr:hypothetical protein [Deltaproteobacteria bacterium]